MLRGMWQSRVAKGGETMDMDMQRRRGSAWLDSLGKEVLQIHTREVKRLDMHNGIAEIYALDLDKLVWVPS